ncbi:hypothetical protein PZT57_30820 [Pseudomonas aeruginosa]|uniref:hypothetical protein n=1 Tax=Pseudomonas aeruginosa TaxID=287 RepID=UPI002B2694BD|nr:hypothetical protein [Pseudomonas aeruginosa]MEA8593043.1 hypothetical protein [Pseudomonas aeruginosa]
MKSIFERLALALQGNVDYLAELQRIREAYEAGVNQMDDVLGFVKRLRFAGAVDASTAGSIEIDLLFVAPQDTEAEAQKGPLYAQNSMLGASSPMDKEGMVWQLEQTIKDLQRQVSTEFRSRYFGECLAMHKTLAMIGWLDSAETDSLYLQIVKAHEQAIGQCLDVGEVVLPEVLQKESYRRQQAEARYAASHALGASK